MQKMKYANNIKNADKKIDQQIQIGFPNKGTKFDNCRFVVKLK